MPLLVQYLSLLIAVNEPLIAVTSAVVSLPWQVVD
jgi:hypothetical protein